MPLLWISLVFLIGILLAAQLSLSAAAWYWLAVIAGLSGLAIRLSRGLYFYSLGPVRGMISFLPFVFIRAYVRGSGLWWRIKPPLPVSVLLVVLTLGAARYQSVQPDLSASGFIAIHNDVGETCVLEGVIVKPPDVRDRYTNLTLDVKRIRREPELLYVTVAGRLLAKVSPGGSWRYGDRLRLHGRLETPPEWEAFSYRDYLARQNVYAYMRGARADLLERDQGNPFLAAIYALRRRALSEIYRLYPDPEASLLAGILLGVESGIPEHVQQAFRDTGTAHIIAISGFNITILAVLFFWLSNRLMGRWLGALVAILGIVLYTLLVGSGPAVVRAAVMGSLALFARQVGRKQDGLNTLLFVAALMALFSPNILWDIGFQLSFMATLGLLLYAEPLVDRFTRLAGRFTVPENAQRLAGPMGEYFLFTLAAQLTTLPVSAYHFQRLSLTSLIANPLILPAQPAVMVLGGLALMLGIAYPPLGQLAAYLVWPFVVFTIRVVELFATFPSGVLVLGQVALLSVVAFYAVLFGWTFFGERVSAWFSTRAGLQAGGRSTPVALYGVGLLVLGVLTVFVWRQALAVPDGRLHLTVLNVGSGDALLIQTPTGRYVLVDGGPSASQLSDALGRRLSLTQRRLDYLVVAAPGGDNLVALPAVLERFPADQVLWAGATHGGLSSRTLQAYIANQSIRPVRAKSGHALELGGGARLRVLAAGSHGATLLLEWRNFQALLPVGIDFESLERLQADPNLGAVSVLLLAESGYAPANPPQWIGKLRPQVVLLSVAADDWQGLPSPETLRAVEPYSLLRTDRNGWIQVSTDGEQMWVQVERR